MGRLDRARPVRPIGTAGVGFRVFGSVSVAAGLEGRTNGVAAIGELVSAGALELPHFSLASLARLFVSGKPISSSVPLNFVWSIGGGWGSIDGAERWQFRAGLALEVTALKALHLGPFIRFHHVVGAPSESWLSAGVSVRVPVELPSSAVGDGADDRCPDAAEDLDGFEDDDGCPEPDNDRDGILDANDACPNEPQGRMRHDGCPGPDGGDRDGDGLLDELDRCPDRPEDHDTFQDDDGCPDPDNDSDGVIDRDDLCPNDPEDKDGFHDEDGCPEPDNDSDGVLDPNDRCPNDQETFDGVDDEDGCPER